MTCTSKGQDETGQVTEQDGTGQVTEQVAGQVTIHDGATHDTTEQVTGQVTGHDKTGQVTIHDGTIHNGTAHDGTAQDKTGQGGTGQGGTGQGGTGQVTKHIAQLIKCLGDDCLSRKELMERLNLKGRDNFKKLYLLPALKSGSIEMTIPDKPQSHNQRYRKKTMDKTKPMDNQP